MNLRLGQLGTRIGIVYLSLSICGCAVGGKGASIDSSSKMPWFNLELKERKKKSSDPPFRSVKFDKGNKSYIEAIRGAESDAAELTSLPRKSSLSLPTTDQALTLDSTTDDVVELDFR